MLLKRTAENETCFLDIKQFTKASVIPIVLAMHDQEAEDDVWISNRKLYQQSTSRFSATKLKRGSL
jgi:hypothetical protein